MDEQGKRSRWNETSRSRLSSDTDFRSALDRGTTVQLDFNRSKGVNPLHGPFGRLGPRQGSLCEADQVILTQTSPRVQTISKNTTCSARTSICDRCRSVSLSRESRMQISLDRLFFSRDLPETTFTVFEASHLTVIDAGTYYQMSVRRSSQGWGDDRFKRGHRHTLC